MTEIFRHYVGIAEALIGRIAKKKHKQERWDKYFMRQLQTPKRREIRLLPCTEFSITKATALYKTPTNKATAFYKTLTNKSAALSTLESNNISLTLEHIRLLP